MNNSYNPNVPQYANNNLAQTQSQFLNNFLKLYNIFSVNHVPIDTASVGGNHTIVQLLEQDFSHQTDVGEISVYTKDVAGQTDQVFVRYQGNGLEFQYTNYQIYSITNIPNQNHFFTFLPGKFIVFFGSFTKLTNNTLIFYPPIAKNLVGLSFCPLGGNPINQIKPKINLLPQENGVFVKMLVTSGLPGSVASAPCNYIIVGNA